MAAALVLDDAWSLFAAARAGRDPAVRLQQALHLGVVFLLPLLAWATASGRQLLTERPRRAVFALLLVDFGYLLWTTLPFVPIGVDECFYAINAHVYAGNDELWHCPSRPPLTSFGALLMPWHPPLLGLLLRSASAWFAYLLAERTMRAPWAAAAPLLVLVAGQLSQHSTSLMSEPYGAACLTAFALALARGTGGGSLGLLAGCAFLARWPLGWLLPVALVAAFRRRRWRGALLALATFTVPVVAVLLWTGCTPWSMLGDRSGWRRSVGGTLLYYLAPDVAFGIGWTHLVLLVIGGLGARETALRCCLLLFTIHSGVLVLTGEATARFAAPAIPIAAVVVAKGLERVGHWGARRWPARPAFAGLLAAVVAVSVAFPPRHLSARAIKHASRQNVVREGRGDLLALLGPAPLFCDIHFLAVTAVLGRKCHAVLPPPGVADDREPRRFQPPGVGLDLEGTTPSCAREALPKGAFYLTYDPGGREVLWQRGELHLVRW